MFLKHFLVVLTNHGCRFLPKNKVFCVSEPEKHLRTITLSGVLHHLDDVLALGPPDPLQPPHVAPEGPDALEGGAVRIHDPGLVVSNEVPVNLCNFYHSALIFYVSRGFMATTQLGIFRSICCRVCWILSSEIIEISPRSSQLGSCHHRVFKDMSFENSCQSLLHSFTPPEPFLLRGMTRLGKFLDFTTRQLISDLCLPSRFARICIQHPKFFL